MYWNPSQGSQGEGVATSLAELLSVEQFRHAITRYTESHTGQPVADSVPPDKVETLVQEFLDKKTKDASLVEVEIAAKVTDRLISWAKAFGFLLGLPIAFVLIVLAVLGFSKFEDVRNAADRADARLTTAMQQVEMQRVAAQQLIDSSKTMTSDFSAKFADAIRTRDENLSSLDNKIRQLTESVDDRIKGLKTTVQDVRLQSFGAAAASVLSSHGKTIEDLQAALQKRGFYDGDINGTFDNNTLNALMAFQKRYGAPVDGVIGARTYPLLFGP
jgi:hypothetical protein